MENIVELNSLELRTINGGATFAYRVGQFLRWGVMSSSHIGSILARYEMQYAL